MIISTPPVKHRTNANAATTTRGLNETTRYRSTKRVPLVDVAVLTSDVLTDELVERAKAYLALNHGQDDITVASDTRASALGVDCRECDCDALSPAGRA